MNLTELHQNASFLDWTRYFNSAFQSVGRKIDSGLEVVNYAPVYLRDESSRIETLETWENCQNKVQNVLSRNICRLAVGCVISAS